ncbi:MAG: metallophosphoesterase [Bacteroidia bacterium]
MRGGPNITGILIFFGFLFLVDLYVFSGVKTITAGLEARNRKIFHWIYWIINGGLFAWATILFLFLPPEKGMPRAFMTFMGVWILFFVPKLIILIVLLGEDVVRFFKGVYAWIYNGVSTGNNVAFDNSRRKFISQIAAGIAVIPFIGIVHGMVSGRFKFRVKRETLYFPDLPDAFDGFTITQLSDIHVGSFDPETDKEAIRAGIKLANDQKSDLMVFTGDLVNNVAYEMTPWEDDFSQLKARHGQFSILGNHDYGDYVNWDSAEEKANNMKDLYAKHEKIGFRLMRNEHTFIEKDGERLYLIGVENWGTGGFPKKGDIQKAMEGVPANAFKVLLSHDPSHWDNIISKQKEHIHLTLSGHTHGMQFGVEIPGIKFSPVQFRYPHWAGLYNNSFGRYLYVNRGFGFLAFPGRVGIWPEITVITLKKSGLKQA